MLGKHKPALDYSFSGGGIGLAHHDIRTGEQWQTRTSGVEFGDPSQLVPVIKSWLQSSIKESLPVRLKLVSAQRDETEPRPTKLAIHFDTWSQSGMEAKAVASLQAMPQSDHLWVGQLGRDGSGRLPRSKIRGVSFSGSFDEYGKVFAGAVDRFLKTVNYDEISISGGSIGGRFAISTAANMDRPVDNLLAVDAPGDRHMSIPRLFYDFSLTEGKRGARYNKRGGQPTLLDWRAAVTFFQRTCSRQNGSGVISERWLCYGNAVRKAGLMGDLERALGNVRHLDLVTMEHSKITDSHWAEQQLGGSAVAYSAEIWLHTVQRHSHAAFSPDRPFLEARIEQDIAENRRTKK
jgi:pimeloyl-ACP methyl ester carboxylesterase